MSTHRIVAVLVLCSLLIAPAVALAQQPLDSSALASFMQVWAQARTTAQYIPAADLDNDQLIDHIDCAVAVEAALAGGPVAGPDGGTYVWVHPGQFDMGADDQYSSKPIHRVRITGGFWLGKYEVTNAQYAAFLNAHGSIYDNDGQKMIYPEDTPWCKVQQVGGVWWAEAGWENHPVVAVTWYGAKAYCDRYGLRLPTEAEWEYAARGTEGRNYPWGNTWDEYKCVNLYNVGPHFTWSDYTGPGTMTIGSIPAGDSWCGASDMAGNVWEWCQDWGHHDYYYVSPVDDPTGPATGQSRLLRGGSWDSVGTTCRSAYRNYYFPGGRGTNLGFRAARTQ